jgi:hypothetical protein
MYLEICPFLSGFYICLNIGSYSNPWWFLEFPWCLLLSPISWFLNLLIWVFSLFILSDFPGSCQSCLFFSKNQLLICWIFLFVCFYFIDLSTYFIISLLLVLGLAWSCVSRSLKGSIRSFIWNHYVFLICVLMAINFPLETSFAVSHRFW